MRSIKIQYFLSFAVMGSLLPFLSVFLKERGLSRVEIGVVIAVSSASVVLTPVLVTLLADGYLKGRRLLAMIFTISGAMLTALAVDAEGFWTALVFFSLYAMAFAPTTALQDGIFFLEHSQHRAAGKAVIPYHRVRVWGTIGFMVPSVLLFIFLRGGASTGMVLVSGVVFCGLGLINSLSLPDTKAHGPDEALPPVSQPVEPERAFTGRLPTIEAARAMLEPHVLVFCIAMVLTHMANAAYYAFYPLYLTDRVGVANEWVGVIANLGVLLEIGYMLAFGRLMTGLGVKRLMVVGVVCLIVRLTLLAASDSMVVAVGTQLVHGLIVLVVHVVPPIFLNRHAHDHYRNSMQGLYTMTVYGCGRISGNLLAGWAAQKSLSLMFALAAVLCVLAAGLFMFAFYEHKPSKPSVEISDDDA